MRGKRKRQERETETSQASHPAHATLSQTKDGPHICESPCDSSVSVHKLTLGMLRPKWLELSGVADSRLNRQAQLWRVAESSHNALSTKRKITQREVYYLHAGSGVFRSQADSNTALQLLSNISRVPRINLGFVTSARGLFCGSIGYSFQDSMDAAQTVLGHGISHDHGQHAPEASFVLAGTRAVSVPSDYLTTELLLSTEHLPEKAQPKFILVVEKECIFQRLAEDRFFDKHPCVLVTAKGMPDIATRAFVWRCHTQLKLTVLGLSDWNPYGLGIMLAYKSGGGARGSESTAFNVPLRWLGLHHAHADRFDVPASAWQELTHRDMSRARGLLEHPSVQWHESYAEELHAMLRSDGKLELEALLSNGLQYMAQTYLPQRLQDSDAE